MEATLNWLQKRIDELKTAKAAEEIKEPRDLEKVKIMGAKLKGFKEVKDYIRSHERGMHTKL